MSKEIVIRVTLLDGVEVRRREERKLITHRDGVTVIRSYGKEYPLNDQSEYFVRYETAPTGGVREIK